MGILDVNGFKNTNYNKTENYNKYHTISSYLLKSQFLNLSQFSHFNNSFLPLAFNKQEIENNDELNNTFFLKDTNVLYQDSDLLTKENLNILYWVLSTQSSFTNSISFFDCFLLLKSLRNDPCFAIFEPESITGDLNFQNLLVLSLSNLDSFYMQDINDLLGY
jgi:hypothetical protein